MRQGIKDTVHVIVVAVLLLVAAVPGFAAEVRRVPSKNLVEQGFLALTLDAEGAEDFRYTGMENQQHIYRGKIKPGAKIKLVMQATLAKQSSLPLTGRTSIARMEVIAKKGGEVIKKQSFKSDNKSNVFVNYTVPEGADTIEVNETFVLNNQSKEEKFNQKCTTKNKLILSTTDAPAVAAKTDSKSESGDKKTGDSGDRKTDVNTGKNSGNESDKKTAGGVKESKGTGKGMLAGAVAAVAAIVGGGFFYMKKRKEDQAVNEEIARKEKLRQQAIQRQQELQPGQEKQNVIQEQPDFEQQLATQQYEAGPQNATQEQNASQQSDSKVAAAGAVGVVMGNDQINASENAQQQLDAAPHFCENCGTPLKPGSKFCENCGAKL